MDPWLASLAAAGLLAMPAAAESVRAVDGDTIKLNGPTYQLWGVDAAETRQECADGWPAGALATAADPHLATRLPHPTLLEWLIVVVATASQTVLLAA